MASNERRLVFGLGKSARIEELLIEWPAGQDQRFQNIEADQEVLAVEGLPKLLPFPNISRRGGTARRVVRSG